MQLLLNLISSCQLSKAPLDYFSALIEKLRVIRSLSAEGFKINRRMLATMSPYINRNLKRYGDYVVDLKNIPQPFEGAINLPAEIFESQVE